MDLHNPELVPGITHYPLSLSNFSYFLFSHRSRRSYGTFTRLPMPPKHAKMKAHMASMRAKRGASDSGGLLSPGTRLILLSRPIDRAPIQGGSVLPVLPLNPTDSPSLTDEAPLKGPIMPRMTLSSSDDSALDDALFADASFSD
jgi:hypothetical protein